MAPTFKITWFKNRQRSDGSFAVYVRVTYNRRSVYVATPYSVLRRDLSADFSKIRDPKISDKVEAHRRELYLKYTEAATETAKDCKDIADIIRQSGADDANVKEFFADHVRKMVAEGRESTAKIYKQCCRHIEAYAGDALMFSQIDAKFLRDLEAQLKKRMGDRGVELYMSALRCVFNKARKKHKSIKDNPFGDFQIKKAVANRDIALTSEQVRKVRQCAPKTEKGRLARDMFILSFALCGMNSCDLYKAAAPEDGRVSYNRSKTKHRGGGAWISVAVSETAQRIIKRYQDKERLLGVHNSFSSPGRFNAVINAGLKEVGAMIGIPNLCFYAARHSWATIAFNECNACKDHIAIALNHARNSITDTYIHADRNIIDELNAQVLSRIN